MTSRGNINQSGRKPFYGLNKHQMGKGMLTANFAAVTLILEFTSSRNEQTDKQKKKQSALKSTKGGLTFTPCPSEAVKKTELELAVAVCCHCSVKTIDHLGEIIKKNGKGSNLGSINLYRTKCSKLITEAIAPAFKEELIKDVKIKNMLF